MDDITGSKAHVSGLVGSGIVTEQDGVIMQAALDRVREEVETSRLEFQDGEEDIHTVVERRVTEIAGRAGAQLHAGRSRNDQVATDLRLFTKRELRGVARRVLGLQMVLLER